MPALTAGDLTNLRTRPIGRRWQLYIYSPVTLWSGTVGGSPDRGDRVLNYGTTGGNIADLIAGMTIRVRDASGNLKDYPSKVRYKSYDGVAGEITIADNDIDWAAGDLLYGLRLWEIWPRIVYIDAGGTQYKDRDVAWVSDAQAQPPKANAGPAAIGTLAGGVCDIVFTDEGSYTVPTGGAVSSYQWAALGGTPAVQAGAENTNTVTYRYNTAGYYYVSLTVTDGNGQTGVRYVPVIIDDGTYGIRENVPTERHWDTTGGWVLSRRLRGIDADDSPWFDGAPVFLVADTYSTATGAFVDNRSNLRWSGWLSEDTTRRSYYSREIIYRAVSSAHILSKTPAFPVGVDPSAAPSNWYLLSQLNLESAAFHLLHWQTTAMWVCDYVSVGEWTTRNTAGERCRADNVLAQVNDVLHAFFGDLRCDRQGILRSTRNLWHLTAGEQALIATVMQFTTADYQNVAYGPRRHKAEVSQVLLMGVAGDGTPYHSGSPAEAPLDGGRPVEVQKLLPLDQQELNRWAGMHLYYQNWQRPARLQMSGEYDVVDPALNEFIAGFLSSFDGKLADGPYSVIDVRFTDDHRAGVTMGEWELLPDPGEGEGTARQIPTTPPQPEPPPLEDWSFEPIIEEYDWPVEVWVATFTKGIYYTTNFTGPLGAMPDWTQHNTGLPDALVHQFAYDRFNPVDERFFAIMTTAMDLYRLEGGSGGNWAQVLTVAQAGTITGVAPSNGALEWVTVDPLNGRVWVLYRSTDASNTNRMFLLYSDLNGDAPPAAWSFVEFAGAGVTFYPTRYYNPVRAYGGNVLVYAHHSWQITFPQIIHAMWYSTDNGASFDFTVIHATSTLYDEGGEQDPLNPTTGYGTRFAGGVYDLMKVTPATAVVIEDAEDLWALVQPRPDIMWFSYVNNGTMKLVTEEDDTASPAIYPQIVETDDSWATPSTKTNLPYFNVRMLASFVHAETDDFLIYGCIDCNTATSITPDITAHHVLVADALIDPSDLTAKGGDNVSTPPYTDSIPQDAGGISYDGLQVVS